MKILHTADWHLGVKNDKRDRIKEQRLVMSEICDIADRENVDIVLVCGDAFHNAVPTSEAEDLFFETIDRLSNFGNRVVVVLAGNHDDPRRLEASTHFARKHNIVLVGDLSPRVNKGVSEKVRIVAVGDGSITIEKVKDDGMVEVCQLALLPYPMEYRLKEKASADTQSGKIEEWAKRAGACFKKGCFNVFASHLMIVGSSRVLYNEVVDVKVGDVSAVSTSVLPDADYVALGHLHTPQIVDKKFVYSGAPIRSSYDQKEAKVVIAEGDGTGLKNITMLDIASAVKMENIEVSSILDAEEKLSKYSDEDLISLTFVQDAPLSHREISALREKFPCVTEIKLILTRVEYDNNKVIQNRKNMDYNELFREFYKSKKLTEPSSEMVELFVEIMQEGDNETD